MPITSSNMNLPIPVVGVDPSPTWATLINQSLTIVDGHNHTNGSGVPIVPGAININSDLTFQGNNATQLRTTRFNAQTVPIPASGTDIQELYVSGVDLYYNDGSGNQIRITQSGGVAGTPGSIANLVSPASASYVAVSGKFVWQQAANTSADMDFGSAIMRNDTASSFALTLQPPTLSGNYSITLPSLPASQKFMTLDASGIMSAPWSVDGSTIVVSGNTLQVSVAGLSGITGSQLANNTITSTQIANSTITGTQMASNVNLPGTTVQENGKNVVVSGTNAATSLAIVRCTFISSSATPTIGEGATASRSGPGVWVITFSTAFASAPTVVCSNNNNSAVFCSAFSETTTGFTLIATNVSQVNVDTTYSFIAIGPR